MGLQGRKGSGCPGAGELVGVERVEVLEQRSSGFGVGGLVTGGKKISSGEASFFFFFVGAGGQMHEEMGKLASELCIPLEHGHEGTELG